MKKTFLIIMCLMVTLFASAQTIEKTYYFGEPNVAQIQGYEQIQFTNCMQSALAGQPSLPWQSVSLMLPQGTEAFAIEVELSDFQTMEGSHNLFPYQSARTYSDPVRRQFEKDEALYASKSVYPAQAYGKLSTQYLNGIGFAFSAFTPVQYVPGTGEVRYATKATVRIMLTASKADQSRKLWLNGGNDERAKRLAQNPEMLLTYNDRGRTVGGYDLLVVTKQQYVASFDEYVSFYQARGLRTRVADLETILSTMSGQDNAEKLRNYIIQEYENNGIMMVNLGGDVPDIPYRGFYCDVLTGGDHQTDNDIPADLYYAALDGTWNDDGDNRWGEIGEDDLLPEIGIGRMCFSNQSELDNMFHKAMTYQTDPVLGEFRDVIMAGEHLYDEPYLSNGSQYLELLIGTRDDNGYTTTGIPEDYNFTRLYEEEGNWSGTLLRNAINQGTQYVHHDGHANTNYVAGWTNGDITNNNFSAVNGVDHNYTFFHTSGCICGDFSSDCILERMTKIANFAVATFGNSRYGWFNEGQTEGPAIHLHRETEDAYYHDRIPYGGMAMREGKIETAPWVNAPGQWEEGALRWNFYDLNMMGDVAVSPWHDEPFTPEVSYASEILVGTTTMDVVVTNGDSLKNFRCALFHGEDMIGVGYTDEDGNGIIEFAEPIDFVGEMSLVVTGCDAWPQSLPVLSIPGNCAYVVYDNYAISGGAQPDFGTSIALDLQIKNVGTLTANNVTATLSTDCDYITLTDATETIPSLDGGATATLAEAFAMDIANNVPNMTKADFTLTCTDGTDIWESKFAIRLYAPEFAVLGTVIDDNDGNGHVDPGETVTAHITVKNAGMAAAQETMLNIICDLPEITYEEGDFPQGTVNADGEFTADFVFTLSEAVELGTAYEIGFNVTSGAYSTNGSFVFTVGNVIEDWESGDFSNFDWENDPTRPWTIFTDNPYEGTYCVKSGSIGSNASTSLKITLDVPNAGEISFFKKVSSESGYDMFYFFIDGTEQGNWSGEVAWSEEHFALTAGQHELRWTYSKDGYVNNGSDCAWLDYIVFPPTNTITVTQETVMNGVTLYPNPNHGQFSINLPEEECEIVVFNAMGQQVYQQSNAKNMTTLNLEGLNNGMYFVTVKSATAVSTLKFVKE